MVKNRIDPEQFERAANMLKAIAHPMRIAIIGYLEDGQELTVTDIHEKLGIEQSTTSHHLGILKDKGVLLSRRDGKDGSSLMEVVDKRLYKAKADGRNGCCSVG